MLKATTPAVSPLLSQRLFAYAIAAAGAVSFAPNADAQVIYTKTDVTLSQGRLAIDLNQDGVTDFTLRNDETADYYFAGGFLSVTANRNESPGVLGESGQQVYEALAVPLGVPIGSDSPATFLAVGPRYFPEMAHAFVSYNLGRKLGGPFANVGDKFLGFKFTTKGEIHYGWARVSVNASTSIFPSITAKLTGYAYEATPNKSIAAGDRGFNSDAVSNSFTQTGPSLGALSLGSAGLPAWRSQTK